MFERLTEKLDGALKKLTGRGRLSENNINDALKEVRFALLEADVNYKVVKSFIEDVRVRAVGSEVLQSLTPGQQFIKIVNEELARLMAHEAQDLQLTGRSPFCVMLVGLQGSGKTTTAAKLASYLRRKGRHPYLVPADVYRPAAVKQLEKLGAQIQVPVYETDMTWKPERICEDAVSRCGSVGADVVIIDTAGRLHVDEQLMGELVRIRETVSPVETLLVADAMTGQDAVNVAARFDEAVAVTGVVLTKMEGDARGGAALSIRAVTGKPVKFIGVGEKVTALEAFHPDRMASQILGMGDVVSLIEKAQEEFDQKEAADLQRKLQKNEFDLEDFRSQLVQVKKLGSVKDILGMLPGMGNMKKLKQLTPDDRELVRVEAIINSMTPEERRSHRIINGSRRRRIAAGSGTTVQDVNRLLKSFTQMKKMMGRFAKKGRPGIGSLFG